MTTLWESTQKARKEHFCDQCCNWILPGETYSRHVWIPRRGSFHVMNEHVKPSCPPNEFEEEMQREAQMCRIPVSLAITTKQVIAIAKNGDPVVENRTVIETVVGEPPISLLPSEEIDDVPF